MLNWAIIGTGNVANEFCNQFNEEIANLYAVYSRDENKGKQFANKHKIMKVYNDYEKLLIDNKVNIIYIATPHNSHYNFIKKALLQGKNVFCEKIIVLKSEELNECIKIARENNLFLAEAMTIHYMPLYASIKDWIKEKRLGPLKLIQANFGSFKDINERYYFKKELAGGALFDIGVYAVNLVLFFFSQKPNQISAFVNYHESGVDESSAIILKNKNNELATISLTFRAKLPKRVVIAFEYGYIEINDYPQANKAVLVKYDGTIDELCLGDSNARFKYEMEIITRTIETSIANPFIEYTLSSLEVIDKIREVWR